MASASSPIKPTAVVPYHSPKKATGSGGKSSVTLSLGPEILERISIAPRMGPSFPKPFKGTCKDLLSKIAKERPHEPVGNVDFNGLTHRLAKIKQCVLANPQQALELSFKAQKADAAFLSLAIREKILGGVFMAPTRGAGLPKPLKGTRVQVLNTIAPTVHATIDSLDYDGLVPYLKVTDQLAQGKTFGQVVIDSRNEERASTCVGMSHAILKSLKKAHGVEGTLAVQRRSSMHAFEHGAVIIECSDGYVLLDARSDPKARIFSIPFNSTVQHKALSLTARGPGSQIPIKMTYAATDNYPEMTFEYCTNVGNGDDLVMKHYVMDASLSFTPIAVYNPDGSSSKYIVICPNEGKIFLKDVTPTTGPRSQTVTFKSILKGELLQKLKAFMGNAGFHLSFETVYEQLVKFASQQERLLLLFRQTHTDE